MIVLGLLVLLAAGGLTIAGATAYNNSAVHAATFRLDLLGYHLQASPGRLFWFGLIIGAAAMLGLTMVLAGLGRGIGQRSAARQQLKGSRRETRTLRRQKDQLLRDQPAPQAAPQGTAATAPSARAEPNPADEPAAGWRFWTKRRAPR